MADENRLFFKLHSGFSEHPKTVGLSDKAFRHLIELWLYCHRNMTDGIVPLGQLSRALSTKTRKELIDAGFLDVHQDRAEMHDYLRHQMSAAEIETLVNKRKLAGAKGGKAKASALASATASALAKPKQTSSKPLADKDKDKDLDQKNVVVTLSDAEAPDHDRDEYGFIDEPLPTEDIEPTPGYPADFTAFWDIYPRRGGKGAAMTAFTKAKKRAPVTRILAGAASLANDPNLPTDKSLIPMPATWLNQDRWEDDPLPARGEPEAHLTSSERRMLTNIQRGSTWQANPINDSDVFTRKAIGT